MPTSVPVQFEFTIPSSYYSDGTVTLKFVHDNPSTSIRAAVPEVWLMQNILEFTPPRFEAVEYNDMDGDGLLSVGDEFYFHFSEEMDTAYLVSGTTDANARLVPEGGLIYGTINQTRWTSDNKTAIISLSDGFTVTGSETITPNGLYDPFGNESIGSQDLTTVDTIDPVFTGLDWIDNDGNGGISLGDQYIFHFSETMDISVIQDGTVDANVYLRPAGGMRYGDVNTIIWGPDGRELAVDVTEGFTILGNELVIPSSLVVDVAGNSVFGSHQAYASTLYVLSMNVSGNGTTSPSIGNHYYIEGSGVSITAVPDSGWEFVSWSGDLTGSANPTTITMDSDKMVTAVFTGGVTTTYTLTTITSPFGGGSITASGIDCPGDCVNTYDEGTVVTVNATPASGWEFVKWTGNVANTGLSTTTVTMNSDKTVTAKFAELSAPKHRLTIEIQGVGSVAPFVGTRSLKEGDVTLTAVTGEECIFQYWEYSGVSLTEQILTIYLTKDITIVAVFNCPPDTPSIKPDGGIEDNAIIPPPPDITTLWLHTSDFALGQV
jgi:hypothetical protein